MINSRTKGVYPAAKALLSAVYEGALVPFDTALKIEARYFTLGPDEPVLVGDDPVAVPQQGSAGKRRQPARRRGSARVKESAFWAPA